MRTISLLLLVVISLASAANRRRSEVLFPELEIPKPKTDKHVMESMSSKPLNILPAIKAAVDRADGMRIHTNYTFPTEVVISKCGVPMLLIFEARTATGIISDDDVNVIADSYNFFCKETDNNTWITLTTKSDPFIEGGTKFTAGFEKEDFGPVKIHNISAPIIAKVDFSLPRYQLNKWPIKIGRLLREASEPNTQMILSVDATNPVYFYLSKCGHTIKRIPSTIQHPYTLNATQINALKVIYYKKCGKWWMDGIIELEIIASQEHAAGTLEFKLVKEEMEKQEEEPSIEIVAIRIILVGLLFVVVCCAAIMIHNIVFLFPNYFH